MRSGPDARSSSASTAAVMAPRPAVRLVAGDHQVADLVDEPEGPDLAGGDRRRTRPGRAAFMRAASRRMPAMSVVTRSPRDPMSVPSTPYRSRAERWTWNARIAPKHGTGAWAHTRTVARVEAGASVRRGGGRGLGVAGRRGVFDGAAEELEPGRIELVGPRADAFGAGEPLGQAAAPAPRARAG